MSKTVLVFFVLFQVVFVSQKPAMAQSQKELRSGQSKAWMVEMGSTLNFENDRTTPYLGPGISYRLDENLYTGFRALFSINDIVQPSRQFLQFFSRHYLTASRPRVFLEPSVHLGLRKRSTVAVSTTCGIQHAFKRQRFSVSASGGLYWAFNSSFGGGDVSPMLATAGTYHF